MAQRTIPLNLPQEYAVDVYLSVRLEAGTLHLANYLIHYAVYFLLQRYNNYLKKQRLSTQYEFGAHFFILSPRNRCFRGKNGDEMNLRIPHPYCGTEMSWEEVVADEGYLRPAKRSPWEGSLCPVRITFFIYLGLCGDRRDMSMDWGWGYLPPRSRSSGGGSCFCSRITPPDRQLLPEPKCATVSKFRAFLSDQGSKSASIAEYRALVSTFRAFLSDQGCDIDPSLRSG